MLRGYNSQPSFDYKAGSVGSTLELGYKEVQTWIPQSEFS
jgi:hypothetical protein